MGRKGESCSPGGLGVAGPRFCGDCGPTRSGVWGLLLSRPGAMGLEVMATSPTSAPGSKLGESQALFLRLGQPLIPACGSAFSAWWCRKEDEVLGSHDRHTPTLALVLG